MNLLAYPRTKPSGVEWLGDVPEHWNVCAVWHVFSLGRGRVISHEDIRDDPGEYPVYSSQTENNGVLGYLGTYDFEGDYVTWTTDGANAGTVFRRTGKFNCTNVCGTLKPTDCERIDTRFAAYALNLATGEFVRHDINPKLMNNVMAKIRFGVASIAEQRAIATFLDREMGRLDRLVAKKRELMERLKEKRTALISRTVTRGLPPAAARAAGLRENPPLKRSGHPWLDDIPRHWEVKRVKEVALLVGRIGFRGYSTEDLVSEGEGAISLSPSNMVAGSINLDKCTWLSWEKYYESPEIQLQPNDVVMVKTGSTLGKTAFVKTVPVSMTINPQLMIFKNVKCAKRFLFYYVFSNVVQDVIPLHNTGSTIPTMTQEGIGKLPFPHPPLPEQAAIASYLDEETAKLDALVGKVEEAVERLQEYRTALITAAVTGKIDVRKAVAA